MQEVIEMYCKYHRKMMQIKKEVVGESKRAKVEQRGNMFAVLKDGKISTRRFHTKESALRFADKIV